MKTILPLSNEGKKIEYDFQSSKNQFVVKWGDLNFSLNQELVDQILLDFFKSNDKWYFLGASMTNPTVGGLGEYISHLNVGLTPRHSSAIAAILVTEKVLEYKGKKPIFLRRNLNGKKPFLMSRDPKTNFENRWNKMNISFQNYLYYVSNKKTFKLTLIDLLYISNFKSGNSAIHEKEDIVNKKLENYSTYFEIIKQEFSGKYLSELNLEETEKLCNLIQEIILLTQSENAIDGFKVSYLSALLHAHFPNLIPILDRRILINLNLVNSKDLSNSKPKQVKKIENFFVKLILELKQHQIELKMTLRELDRYYFIQELPKWAR